MTVPRPGPPPRPADPRPGGLRSGVLGPTQPRPTDVGENVARAMAGLDGLDDRPLAEHVAAFERVHAALGEALADPSGPE